MRLLPAVGFGESRPIAPNDTPAGMAENRRTEFHVVEVNGRLFQNRDPTNGGYVLDVQSIEERKLARERIAQPRAVPKKKVFTATGNETHEIPPPPPAKAGDT